MDCNEQTLKDCKVSWREEAARCARQEAEDHGISGDTAKTWIERRSEEIYAELEKFGLENL